MKRTIYKVYEVAKDCRLNGRLLKKYRSKERAYNFMNKSIFRFIKEDILISD